MAPALIVPHLLLPRSAIDLGWLVLRRTHPPQDYHALVVPATSTVSASSRDLLASSERASSTNFRTQLTKHLATSLGARSDSAVELSAAQATNYHIKNSQEWYEAQRHDEDTKRWLERAIERGLNVYVVVGLYTLQHVCVSGCADRNTILTGQSRIGIRDVVAMTSAAVAAAIPSVAVDMADVAIGAGGKARKKRVQRFVVEEELVYAVQYRKIQIKWYSSGHVEKIFLETGNRWQVLWNIRGDDNEEDEEDVIEALIA